MASSSAACSSSASASSASAPEDEKEEALVSAFDPNSDNCPFQLRHGCNPGQCEGCSNDFCAPLLTIVSGMRLCSNCQSVLFPQHPAFVDPNCPLKFHAVGTCFGMVCYKCKQMRCQQFQSYPTLCIFCCAKEKDPNCASAIHSIRDGGCKLVKCEICFLGHCDRKLLTDSTYGHAFAESPVCFSCVKKAAEIKVLPKDDYGRYLHPVLRLPFKTCICGQPISTYSPCYWAALRQQPGHDLVPVPADVLMAEYMAERQRQDARNKQKKPEQPEEAQELAAKRQRREVVEVE